MNTHDRIKKIEKELAEIKKQVAKEVNWHKIGDFEVSENLGDLDWNAAMEKAKESGGRIPERWEWIKIVDENYDELQTLIKDDPSNYFWSATEYLSTNAWTVVLNNGNTYNNNKSTSSYYVRCVR